MKLNHLPKLVFTLGLLAMTVLFTGCPFSSSVPIDEGTVKVDDMLVGKWVSMADTEAEKPTYFEISKDDKFHATARKMEYSTDDKAYKATVYNLTFSDVSGETFMNAIEKDGDAYSLYKFNFDRKASQITTSEVTDYIKETFTTSAELKTFVAMHKSNSYFYTNTSDTYMRK